MMPISCNQRNRGHRKAFVPRSPTGSCSLSATVESGLEEWKKNFDRQRSRGRAFQAQGRLCNTRAQVCSQVLSSPGGGEDEKMELQMGPE